MDAVEVKLITPGVIAKRLCEPLHRVLHVLATRGHIKASARAGTLRSTPKMRSRWFVMSWARSMRVDARAERGDVVIDPAKEPLLPLAKAARLDVLRQTAAWGNPRILYRWTRKPVRGRVLESLLAGGQICVSEAAKTFLNQRRRRIRRGVGADGRHV